MRMTLPLNLTPSSNPANPNPAYLLDHRKVSLAKISCYHTRIRIIVLLRTVPYWYQVATRTVLVPVYTSTVLDMNTVYR